MTDNEIIKALEDEVKSAEYVDSYYRNGVDLTLIKSAIDLINRQKTEIERLKECPKCFYEYDGEVTEYCIQSPCPNFKPVYVSADLSIKQIKNEAYKEFAERLKNKWFSYYSPAIDFDDFIDNLVEEMVGEE